MIVLTIRTDKPEAEIGLFEDGKELAYETWQAHRQLAETIHLRISDLLSCQGTSLTASYLAGLGGIVAYKGPGSFTGLRIGLSVANALAAGWRVPIVATNGTNWRAKGLAALKNGKNDRLALPRYGSPARITIPKK